MSKESAISQVAATQAASAAQERHGVWLERELTQSDRIGRVDGHLFVIGRLIHQ